MGEKRYYFNMRVVPRFITYTSLYLIQLILIKYYTKNTAEVAVGKST